MKKRTTVMIAAHERDNFGDLLYNLENRHYLGDDRVISAAPFAADMTELLGTKVEAYRDLATIGPIDRVWIGGGGLGGVTLASAYKMSCSDEIRSNLAPAELVDSAAAAFGAPPWCSPYLPDLCKAFGLSIPVTVINSAALSGVIRLPVKTLRSVHRVIRHADFVSVRDRRSKQVMNALGLRVDLAPDIIHGMRFTSPVVKTQQAERPVAIIQWRTSLLANLSNSEIASALASTSELAGYAIRFLPAGTAPEHDCVEDYVEVAQLLRAQTSGWDVGVLTDPDPYKKAMSIANADLYIGSSLHGQVVSIAYEVPHVLLRLPKLETYARSWSDPMPIDASMATLGAAIGRALEPGVREELKRLSPLLADQAVANARRAAGRG